MAGNYTRRINLYINGVQVRNDIKSISAEFRKLERHIRTLNIGSREYNREMAKLKYLRAIIDDHNAALRNTQLNLTSLKGLANAFNKYWPVVMGTVGAITGLIFGTRRASEEFAEFDDKLADVMKVTGLTRAQVIELNKALMQFDTRTAQNDLLDLAYVAGKLGYTASEDILGFVRAADKIAVALAKDLGGSAEDAIKAVGKAVEIFDLKSIYGIEEAMIRTGSAINVLGMASVAQEGYLVSFLERVAGIAPLAGVSAQNILGLAAALDIYAQKSEVSATAYSKLMSKMATESEAMARILNMTIEDYKKAFTEDANETMLRLFETLKGEGNAAFGQLVEMLGETELDGQRMNQVMGTLVKNVARIREQQELSNKAFEDGTSVLQEYDIKNNTAKATLERKQKRITELRKEMGERLLPVYLQTLSVYEKFIYATTTVIEFLFRNARALLSLLSAILAYRIALAVTNKLQSVTIMLSGLQRVAVLALTVAYNKLTGHTTRAAAATKLLSAALKTTPWGVVAGAVASLIAFMAAYISIKQQTADMESGMQKVDKQVLEDYSEKEARIRLLIKAIENENLVLSYRKTALEELKRIVPEYHGYLTEEGKLIDSNTESINNYLAAFKKQIRVAALKDEYARLYTEQREIGKLLSEAILERQRIEEQYKTPKGTTNLKGEFLDSDMSDSKVKKKLENDIKDRIEELSKKYNQISQELLSIEVGINAEYVKPPGENDEAEGGGGGGTGKLKADYSEDAEIRARIAAKQKYQKGIIKSETDLQTELDNIALRFMRGRLAQMDKHAEDRAELQEKIVDQELKIAREKQKQLEAVYETGVEFSPRQKLDLEFNNELKKLNIFHKEKKDLTAEELQAYEALRKKHQDQIDKLDAEAIKDEITRRQEAFDTALANVKAQHIKELDAVETFEQAMEKLRQTHSEEELKDIKTLNDAKLLIQKDQQKKEADLAIEHIDTLITLLNTFADEGKMEGVSFLDNIISAEEWEAAQKLINELIEQLQKLKKERKEATGEDGSTKKDPGLKLRGRFRTDILGFSTEDWETLFDKIEDTGDKIEELADRVGMAAYAIANAWSQANQIAKNNEDKALAEYERRIDYRKKLLDDQLEQGIITQEIYNEKTRALDEKLDRQKAIIARRQAIRDRNVAMFEAIINTAVAITKVLDKPWLMALVGIAGGLQLATITTTPLPEIPGKDEGGFLDVIRSQDRKKFRARHDPNRRGWITRPTVITGEKPGSREYVIPDEAMDNPSIAALIRLLDMARINHNLKTVDLASALPALPGRATGGFVLQSPPPQATSSSVAPSATGQNDLMILRQLAISISSLNSILASGHIRTRLVYQDLRDMDEKVDTIENESAI